MKDMKEGEFKKWVSETLAIYNKGQYLTQDSLNEFIGLLKRNGLIFEPKPGHIELVC